LLPKTAPALLFSAGGKFVRARQRDEGSKFLIYSTKLARARV